MDAAPPQRAFLQAVENKEVQRCVNAFRKEVWTFHEAVEAQDARSLNDLAVLHNANIRRRDEMTKREAQSTVIFRPRGGELWDELSQVDRAKHLRTVLRLVAEVREAEEAKEAQEVEDAEGADASTLSPGRGKPSEDEASAKNARKIKHLLELMGNTRKSHPSWCTHKPKVFARETVRQPCAHELQVVALVATLLGECGSLRKAFARLDSRGEGSFSIGQWEDGLASMGYAGSAAPLFTLLDTDRSGRIDLQKFMLLRAVLGEVSEELRRQRRKPKVAKASSQQSRAHSSDLAALPPPVGTRPAVSRPRERPTSSAGSTHSLRRSPSCPVGVRSADAPWPGTRSTQEADNSFL